MAGSAEVRPRRRLWFGVGGVLLLGWAISVVGWLLTEGTQDGGATPPAAAMLGARERSEYSAGAGPAPSTVGRLFGPDHSCTATVLSSSSGDVAVTAAHCVYQGGRWRTPLRFYPGYSHGTARFGVREAERAWVPATWQEGPGRLPPGSRTPGQHDIAFLRLHPDRDGRHAEQVLGAQGLTFDSPAGKPVVVTGYPGVAPFDGESQQSCSDTAQDASSPDGPIVGIVCDLNSGSSGAVWITDLDPATGLGYAAAIQAGLSGDHSYGPPLGPEAEQLYEAADQD